MKIAGKPTKTEWLLLFLTGAALVGLFLLSGASRPAEISGAAVSTRRQAPEQVTPEVLPPEEPEPLDINTANLEELETLTGIGPVLAQRIIDWREENGPFRTVEDLLEVKGIGPATLEKFRDQVTVGAGAEAGNENTEDPPEEAEERMDAAA